MNARSICLLVIVMPLHACATAEPASNSSDAYRPAVARGLGYYEGTDRRYLISAPWHTLDGRIGVCTREEIDDGRGGKTPGAQLTMHFLNSGRITESVPDINCMYRDFGPLQPVKR